MERSDLNLDTVYKAQAGDQEAFTSIYEALFPAIRAIVGRISPFYCEENTQEVLVKIWEAMRTGAEFKNIEQFRAFVFQAARNKGIDSLKSERRNQANISLDQQTANTSAPQNLFADTLSVEEEVLKADAQTRLSEALAILEPAQARAIRAIYLQDKTISETAAELHKTEGAIRILTFRGRKTLRNSIDPNDF